jgi:hypothetical protein
VQQCQWLLKLHAFGLLNNSFQAQLWHNGDEWAQRQSEKAGLAYEALEHSIPKLPGCRACAENL